MSNEKDLEPSVAPSRGGSPFGRLVDGLTRVGPPLAVVLLVCAEPPARDLLDRPLMARTTLAQDSCVIPGNSI